MAKVYECSVCGFVKEVEDCCCSETPVCCGQEMDLKEE